MRTTAQPNTIAAAVDAAHEAINELPRAHLGASVIGHPCERWIWLSFRWAVREKFSGRILRLFRRGQLEERTVHEDLRAAGCKVQTIDPATRKQYAFKEGHFGGSCDGIIASGLPEAPKTPHVLEIKTHSLKSFNDLEKNGVKKSKPQHWAQMQVYMGAFKIDDALYYAVCKDDDRIYTERVKLDQEAADKLIAKAQALIKLKMMPPPLSVDPTWYECKYCAAHDFCHGSQLTKEVNCRTCLNVHIAPEGSFWCDKWECEVPSAEAQLAGCDEHIFNLHMVPDAWKYKFDGTRKITWLTPHGPIEQPKFKSREIVANAKACASGDPLIAEMKEQFGGEIVK